MTYVYLQCDCRFNKWFFEKIGSRYAIEYTIERCKQISEIVAGIYVCEENKPLVDILEKYGVNIYLSDEENVNTRFLDIASKLKGHLVVRACGDQVLLDSAEVNRILHYMEENDLEFFYESTASSILPDIVSVDCLKKHRIKLETTDRYFRVLSQISGVKRYIRDYPLLLPYEFRVCSNCNYRVCKNIIENHLNIYELSEKMLIQATYRKSYFVQTGLLGSWIIPPEYSDFYYDENGTVNPWLGRSVIELIKAHLSKDLRVFEWGIGNSTLFWSSFVQSVVSVEHNKAWFDKMSNIVPENVEPRYVPFEGDQKYCEEILDTDGMFDIVMIDGVDRVNCARHAVKKLQPKGVVIWDNTEREQYREGFDFLRSQGFKQLELSGFLYGYLQAGYTSIFYRRDNFFGL